MFEKSIQGIRGFNDIYDESAKKITQIEDITCAIAKQYGYSKIILPLLEKTKLFQRTVGETSDIVNKEMYTFTDKNQESISLRPEGTASCVRMAIEHNLTYNSPKNYYYFGPMFRRERPQKGRFRQFYQFGIESLNAPEPFTDIEHLIILKRIWNKFGLNNSTKLEINYLANSESREKHLEALRNYYNKYTDLFDELLLKRLRDNPLRILDSKDKKIIEINHHAPAIDKFYLKEELDKFNDIQNKLSLHNIDFTINKKLVRGLDYYSGLIYEWIAVDSTSSQNTVCGGGRYDKLFSYLGGKPTPATGFSIGIERLQELVKNYEKDDKILVVLANLQESCYLKNSLLAEKIRDHCKNINLVSILQNSKPQVMLKKANKINAEFIILSGEDEHNSNNFVLKNLNTREQQNLTIERLISTLQNMETI